MKSIIVSMVAGLMVAGPALAVDVPAESRAKCGACHALDKAGIGPSYNDIAAKYKGDADAVSKLVASITKGGEFGYKKGKMPPKGLGATDTEVKTMAEFIAGLAADLRLPHDESLPHDEKFLSIESVDIEGEQKQAEIITFKILLRNTAPYAQAYPSFEVLLTDEQERYLEKRIIQPTEYLKSDKKKMGFAPNSDLQVILRVKNTSPKSSGYRLLAMYPQSDTSQNGPQGKFNWEEFLDNSPVQPKDIPIAVTGKVSVPAKQVAAACKENMKEAGIGRIIYGTVFAVDYLPYINADEVYRGGKGKVLPVKVYYKYNEDRKYYLKAYLSKDTFGDYRCDQTN